ncbi:MAG: TonB C-terminal domain-containing protein [Syntrophorhabdaceae bacterium]|nr:TonB C-terminal domain-containing protein [Syntrophorhabdaceae bacterium]
MREESWYKMLVFSTILHLVVITAVSIPIKKPTKKIELSSTYSVNLIGELAGSISGQPQGLSTLTGGTRTEGTLQKKESEKITRPQPSRKKQIPERKETKAISISKNKLTSKTSTHSNNTLTKDELIQLEKRIGEIKRKTNYLDVTQMKAQSDTGKKGPGSGSGIQGYGLPVSGQAGGKPLDLVSQKYIFDIWEKIKEAWGLPGSYTTKKDLESIVTIKIRKDGRIIDINFEKRSGNRLYDESILRAIRSIDPLPPIPPSFNADTVEIGFRFLPGDIS